MIGRYYYERLAQRFTNPLISIIETSPRQKLLRVNLFIAAVALLSTCFCAFLTYFLYIPYSWTSGTYKYQFFM